MRLYAHACLTGLLPVVALSAQSFVAVNSGLNPTPDSVFFGAGMATADFDLDGDMDVVTVDVPGNPLRYWRNEGNLQFSDRTSTAGFAIAMPVTHGLNAADIDNDGDADLFVGCWFAPAQLYINDGTGSFTEEAALRGVDSVTSKFSSTFGDYDKDGWLDLYVCNRATHPTTTATELPNLLYHNIGNGFFVEVGQASGAAMSGLTFAATWLDYNDDGWPDIATANDKGIAFSANSMLRNNGDGTFTEVGPSIAANVAMDGMGIDFADVFNDGGWDYYVSDTPSDHLFNVWNPVTGQYMQRQATYGMTGGGVGWAINFLDVNNDRWQDLYVVQAWTDNLLFVNPGVPPQLGSLWLDFATGAVQNGAIVDGLAQYTAIIVDLDNDGRLDIVQRHTSGAPFGASVQRNVDASNNNWLKFDLEGVASNRDGFGTQFRLKIGNMTQRLQARNGQGFLSSSDPRVHFGLGMSPVADRVDVTWPSGRQQVLYNVAANQIIDLVEPTFTIGGTPTVGSSCTLDLEIQGSAGQGYLIALSASDTPTALGAFTIPVALDALFELSLTPGNGFLTGESGLMSPSGLASATLAIPAIPGLVGATVYGTAITIDPASSPVFRPFPDALPITFQ